MILAASMLGAIGLFVFLGVFHNEGNSAPRRASRFSLKDIPFNGESALKVLHQICRIGPRISGSQGMQTQQNMLINHFRELGGEVEMQSFVVRHPETGQNVTMANMIVQWHPERKRRVLLCAHYDTRPYPDQDRNNPRGRFIGANDGASGVALLAEMGRHMRDFDSPVGVDFVLFDGEEFVFDGQRDKYFLGSEHFARLYVSKPPEHKYEYGVLLDMVADAELHLYQETNSMRWRDTRPLTQSIWNTAQRLGVREFVPRIRHEVRDDHLALHNIAKIPTCDIIDFDYPRPGRLNYWHTTHDTPDKCSALSLAKVGWVVHEWLKRLK